MPTDWLATFVLRKLDESIVVTEMLLFSGLLVFDSKSTRLRTAIAKLAAKVLELGAAVKFEITLRDRMLHSGKPVQFTSDFENVPELRLFRALPQSWSTPAQSTFTASARG